ncbi:hypothetical protein V2J09_009516 [Rumex salicifolius]
MIASCLEGVEETYLHIVRDYPVTKDAWMHLEWMEVKLKLEDRWVDTFSMGVCISGVGGIHVYSEMPALYPPLKMAI